MRRADGQMKQGYVRPDESEAHLAYLLDAGLTLHGISRQAGLAHRTVTVLAQGERGFVQSRVADAIMAVQPKDVPLAKWQQHGTLQSYTRGGCRCEACSQAHSGYYSSRRQWIDPLAGPLSAALRQVRRDTGETVAELADRVGVARRTMRLLLNGDRKRVRSRVADRIWKAIGVREWEYEWDRPLPGQLVDIRQTAYRLGIDEAGLLRRVAGTSRLSSLTRDEANMVIWVLRSRSR